MPSERRFSIEVPRVPSRRGVEAGGGLVEEEQLGPPGERHAEVEPAALAAGQRPDERVALADEPDEVDDLVHRARRGVGGAVELDRLADGEVRADPGLLRDDADPLAERAASPLRVDAEDADVAGAAPPIPLEDLDGRRLAGAVGTEQREDLAAGDGQVDAGDGVDVVIGLVQASNDDGGVMSHAAEDGCAAPRAASVDRPIGRSQDRRRSEGDAG